MVNFYLNLSLWFTSLMKVHKGRDGQTELLFKTNACMNMGIWAGRRDESHITKRVMSINVNEMSIERTSERR
jgi:hypothetical protein